MKNIRPNKWKYIGQIENEGFPVNDLNCWEYEVLFDNPWIVFYNSKLDVNRKTFKI